MTRDTIAATVC